MRISVGDRASGRRFRVLSSSRFPEGMRFTIVQRSSGAITSTSTINFGFIENISKTLLSLEYLSLYIPYLFLFFCDIPPIIHFPNVKLFQIKGGAGNNSLINLRLPFTFDKLENLILLSSNLH